MHDMLVDALVRQRQFAVIRTAVFIICMQVPYCTSPVCDC